jgi:nitroimidazol reductase NimA-like FMN-containing flavoprotein (pyridoxamine 5'-phosphate oxidase superfamily)
LITNLTFSDNHHCCYSNIIIEVNIMRRFEHQISNLGEIEGIIRSAKVCRLALSVNGQPYIVPLCFGYQDGVLYFHSAREGKKLDMLSENRKVCFEIDIDQRIVENENPCNWGMKYKSVIGYGVGTIVEDDEEKRAGFDAIMKQYSNGTYSYPDAEVVGTTIIRVDIDSMTAKVKA